MGKQLYGEGFASTVVVCVTAFAASQGDDGFAILLAVIVSGIFLMVLNGIVE